MANKIQLKRSNIQNKVPSTTDVDLGELALNTYDGKLYTKKSDGTTETVVQLSVDSTVVKTTDSAKVTSAMIVDGTIVNGDINASAAIAGTKISPDFGSQTVTTTGVISAAAGAAGTPSIAFTGDLNTGIYSPGADQVAISTNGTGRLFVGSGGDVNIDSGTFYVDATNNRVGVNTTSPISPLEVIGSYISTRQSVTGDQGLLILKGNSGGAAGATIESSFSAGGYGPLTFTTSASERLRITSAGLVGVGTSTPDRRLHVEGAASTTYTNNPVILKLADSNAFAAGVGGGISFTGKYNSGGAFADLAFISGIKENATDGDYAGALVLGTRPNGSGGGSMERLRITSGGNVGIGTASPAVNHHVYGASGVITSRVQSGSGTVELAHNGTDAFLSTNGGSTVFYQSTTERARIDSSGRLLVGTSTSTTGVAFASQIQSNAFYAYSASLFSADNIGSNTWFLKSRNATVNQHTAVQSGDVLGRINFAGSDGDEFIHAALIQAVVDNGAVGTAVSNNECPAALVFSTTADGASSPTERMRISNNGYVGINGTASRRLEVFDTRASEFAAAINNESTTGHALALICKSSDTVGIYLNGYSSSANTTRINIYSNGNILNSNNSYGALSDARLKDNITDASSQWDDIKAVQVRNYNLKTDPDHRQIGVVAQEIEQVSPGLVYESPDRDAEGNDLGTVTKSVNYSVLYMKAVKALQEAMERIETLEAKVAALESA